MTTAQLIDEITNNPNYRGWKFEQLQPILLALLNSNGGGYTSYTALLTQTGTNAPTATVLLNTLGGEPVWSYVDVGLYAITLNGAFTANKTFVLVGCQYNSGQTDTIVPSIEFANVTENSIPLGTRQIEGGALTNGILEGTSIEIRVYP